MYLLEKAIMYARNRTLMRWRRRWPGVVDLAKLPRAPRSVGFDMSNALHVHIGDQLFLEPVIRQFRNRGVPTIVAPTPSMREYFTAAGYDVRPAKDVLAQELRVAPVWMYDWIARAERGVRFIYLDTTDHDVVQPITNHLAERLVEAAHLPGAGAPIDGRPFLVSGIATPLDDQPGRWIAFNDAVDSGAFRTTPANVETLWATAAARHAEGYRIVRVGSAGELARSPAPLPFEHLDLRGQTSVVGLFALLGTPHVHGTLSFDTAVAHMALACGKPAQILMRRFAPAHTRFVKNFVIPSYVAEPPARIDYL